MKNVSLEPIMAKLKEPFPSSRLSWRVGRAGKNSSGKIWVKALAYFDARDGMDRLDEVVGAENWRDSYRKDADSVICRLEIKISGEWVGKEDGAEETDIEAVKGGLSGSFKRACVKWGIGRYLYNLSEGFATVCDQSTEGAIYAKTNELGVFYWLPPTLPDFARPESERGNTPTRPTIAPPPSDDLPSFPTPAKPAAVGNPGDFVMPFGKYKGQTLEQMGAHGVDTWRSSILRNMAEKNEQPKGTMVQVLAAVDAFLASRSFDRKAGA